MNWLRSDPGADGRNEFRWKELVRAAIVPGLARLELKVGFDSEGYPGRATYETTVRRLLCLDKLLRQVLCLGAADLPLLKTKSIRPVCGKDDANGVSILCAAIEAELRTLCQH